LEGGEDEEIEILKLPEVVELHILVSFIREMEGWSTG